MTKADIVSEIAKTTGIDRANVLETVEKFMEVVKDSLVHGENVYLRGFGSFIIKVRSEKTARNISKNTTIIIPEHKIPAFKPAKVFMEEVKNKKPIQFSILSNFLTPKRHAQRKKTQRPQDGYTQAQKAPAQESSQEEIILFSADDGGRHTALTVARGRHPAVETHHARRNQNKLLSRGMLRNAR